MAIMHKATFFSKIRMTRPVKYWRRSAMISRNNMKKAIETRISKVKSNIVVISLPTVPRVLSINSEYVLTPNFRDIVHIILIENVDISIEIIINTDAYRTPHLLNTYGRLKVPPPTTIAMYMIMNFDS